MNGNVLLFSLQGCRTPPKFVRLKPEGGGADFAHLINTCNPFPGFSDLPTALLLYCYARRQVWGWVIKMNGNAIEGGFFISQGEKNQHRRRRRRRSGAYVLWPIDDRGCCRLSDRRRYRRRRRHWCCLCDEAGRSALGVFKTSGRSKADDMSINPLSICLNLLQCTSLSGWWLSRKQAWYTATSY